MNIETLAKELAGLRYETGYRFENGEPFRKRLSEQDVRGILSALRERGFSVSHDGPPHMESPALFGAERPEPESAH